MTHTSSYNTKTDDLPYFYLRSYGEFCKKSGEEIQFFLDEQGNSMACKKWRNKLLTFLQPLYPPLTASGDRLKREAEQRFLNDFTRYVKKERVADRISQPPAFAIFHATPASCIRAPFGTYFLDLAGRSLESLHHELHGKHRNVIRNAEKNQVEIRYGKSVLNDFYMLYAETMQRSGMYLEPLSFFERFFDLNEEYVLCAVAYHDQVPQGALFMPYTRFGAFYLYGASAGKIAVNGAMNYLHWNAIRILKEKRVRRYDFVGARLSATLPEKLKGIQQFKERFGSTLEKGYLWKKDISIAKCKAYDNLLNLKLKLKGQKVPLDIISQEILNYAKAH